MSNESAEPVYFDDIQVTHERKQIIEENHYYAYGLKIAAISSKKLGDIAEGSLKNNYLYNDKELWEDADLNWYDYGFRNYDPQIGRFPQLDPLTWKFTFLTPFQYASCDPIANIDLDGLEGLSAIARATNRAAGFINQANNTVKSFSNAAVLFSFARFAVNIAGNQYSNAKSIRGYLYGSMDAAAIAAAKIIAPTTKGDGNEYSSIIFKINTSSNKERYGHTQVIRFKDDKRSWKESPGPGDEYHLRKLPKGAKVVGHIHSHTGTKGARDNNNFSPSTFANRNGGDEGVMRQFPSVKFYLVAPNGNLITDEYGLPIMTNLPGAQNTNLGPPKVVESIDKKMKEKDPYWLEPKETW